MAYEWLKVGIILYYRHQTFFNCHASALGIVAFATGIDLPSEILQDHQVVLLLDAANDVISWVNVSLFVIVYEVEQK